MRLTPVMAAALVALSGPALAGGFDDAITIPAPLVTDTQAGSLGSLGGLGGTAAILGPVALLAILAAAQDDEDEAAQDST